MDGESKKCQAKLKNGKPCRYKAKPEYKGYCGVHKQAYSRSNDERDQRLALLVTVGTQLVELTTRAVEYLPNLIEVFAAATHVQFLDESPLMDDPGTPLSPGQSAGETLEDEDTVSFTYSPKELPNTMAHFIQDGEWQRLANMLSYSFEVELNSGDIPRQLHARVIQKKRNLEQLLAHLGYKPNLEAIARPVYVRTLND